MVEMKERNSLGGF